MNKLRTAIHKEAEVKGGLMEARNLKLLFFSDDGSDFRSFNISFRKQISILVFLLIGCILFAGVFTFVHVKLYQNYKISQLNRQNAVLISQLSSMEQRFEAIKGKLKKLEDFDNDLRIFVGLPKLDEDVRDVGIGGTTINFKNFDLEDLPVSLNNRVSYLNVDIAQLEREIDLEFNSFQEIQFTLENNKKKIRGTPSIRPVKDGWLQSEFGNRIDPFEDIEKHHNGVDIAAPMGSIVNAPADGIIKDVRTKDFSFGYGRYVTIDHGDGIETLFGHLSSISVKKGQKVKRNDPIGEVGRSGRATGYHLHYEVKRNAYAVNPRDYFLDK